MSTKTLSDTESSVGGEISGPANQLVSRKMLGLLTNPDYCPPASDYPINGYATTCMGSRIPNIGSIKKAIQTYTLTSPAIVEIYTQIFYAPGETIPLSLGLNQFAVIRTDGGITGSYNVSSNSTVTLHVTGGSYATLETNTPTLFNADDVPDDTSTGLLVINVSRVGASLAFGITGNGTFTNGNKWQILDNVPYTFRYS